MSHQMKLLDDLKRLVRIYEHGAPGFPQEPLSTEVEHPNSRLPLGQLDDLTIDPRAIIDHYSDLQVNYEVPYAQGTPTGSQNINFTSDYRPDHVMPHGPELGQNLSAPAHYPIMVPQSSFIASSGYRGGDSLDTALTEHDTFQHIEARASQAPTISTQLDLGTIRLDELYPRHQVEDRTIFRAKYDLSEEPSQNSNAQNHVLRYRVDWAYLSEIGSPPYDKLPSWRRSEDGKVVVNAEGVTLGYSKYLPETVSTQIPGWEMKLIMKYDPRIKFKDFFDRMPINSNLHPRRTISALQTRCKTAGRKYEFHALNTAAIAGQQDIDN